MTDSQNNEPRTVLLVEDEAILRMVAANILEEGGFNVLQAPDASSALRVLESKPDVDVLFTDIQMPGPLDGVELARVVHERWPDISLLLTSGRCHLSREEVPDDGRFFSKPYTSQKLLDEVHSVIAAH
jgi:two-component system, response regulator PdtaR